MSLGGQPLRAGSAPSRNERPRPDLLQQESLGGSQGRDEEDRRRISQRSALAPDASRPYHLATTDTSVARTWIQQDRKKRRLHSLVRRARRRNLHASRATAPPFPHTGERRNSLMKVGSAAQLLPAGNRAIVPLYAASCL